MYEKMLIAYDGSPLSRKAIEAGKNQTIINPESEIHVILVLEAAGPNTNLVFSKSISNEMMEKFRPEMKEIEEEFKQKDVLIITDILLAEPNQNPGDVITDYADDHKMDLIIMGSRGLGNVQRLFLGSVSNNVVQHSKIPILIIK